MDGRALKDSGGSTGCVHFRSALLALVVLASSCCCYPLQVPARQQKCNMVIYNFGDSNSDTGGFASLNGSSFKKPEGRAFFNKFTGRLCDGRLIVDFLCESVGTGYLRPYLDAVGAFGSNFTDGANFAMAGVTADPGVYKQVSQFIIFQLASLDLSFERPGQLVDHAGFDNAVFILDIGQNDIFYAFKSNLSAAFSPETYKKIVHATIPHALKAIKSSVINLYSNGARTFWIHNTGPLGCLPTVMDEFPSGDLDPERCLRVPNDAARVFNSELAKLCDRLRAKLTDATLVYVDVFAVKYDLIANASTYGFDGPPLTACYPCYRHDNVPPRPCDKGAKYLSWDGVHYSEAANSIIAAKIMSGNHSYPPLPFNAFCNI